VPNPGDFSVAKYTAVLPFRITTASVRNATGLIRRISRPCSEKIDLPMTVNTVLTMTTD